MRGNGQHQRGQQRPSGQGGESVRIHADFQGEGLNGDWRIVAQAPSSVLT
jgi:hypothetical protein